MNTINLGERVFGKWGQSDLNALFTRLDASPNNREWWNSIPLNICYDLWHTLEDEGDDT